MAWPAPFGYTKVPCDFSNVTGLRGFIQIVAFPCYSCQMCSLQLLFFICCTNYVGEKLHRWSQSSLLAPVYPWIVLDIADVASPVLLVATACIFLP